MDRMVFLDNVRSAYNVGSIFRTCEGAGVSRLFLSGYTPTPVDRFNRSRLDIKKTALGATDLVPWQSVPSGEEVKVLEDLKSQGHSIIVVEQLIQIYFSI